MPPSSSTKKAISGSRGQLSRMTSPMGSVRRSISDVREDVTGSSTATRVIVGIIAVVIIALIIWAIVAASTSASRRRNQTQQQQRAGDQQEQFTAEGGQQKALVYLHMDGCKYCQRFDPVWKDLKSKHQDELTAMGVDLKDHEAKSAEAQRLDPDGYPTILFSKNGEKVATFQGERTVSALMGFVKANAKEPDA